jgi:hypothetical protein
MVEGRPLSAQDKAAQARWRNQELKRRQRTMNGVLGGCEVFEIYAGCLHLYGSDVIQGASPEDFEAWERALDEHAERVAYVRAWLSEHRP